MLDKSYTEKDMETNGTTPSDVEEAQLSPPYHSSPRIIMLGETAKKWMLSIKGRVVTPPGAHMVDFTTALAALFACYVFNLQY
ncbi:hypothetical protein F2P79_016386 [Pimephales promelas]|nr:hypothetical protein F2P79_016386 [Pimephales promelas]